MTDKKDTDPADQLSVPTSDKRRRKMTLEQATEAIMLRDGSLGQIAVPTTPDGNRNYQLYMVSVLRAVCRKMLIAAKKNDYANITPQQLKDLAQAMKIAGEMAAEAFQNPEDPNNDIPKEISPMKGIMDKLLKNANTLSNPNSSKKDVTEALEDIDFTCSELEGSTQEDGESEEED